jgi:hypothetical protein
MSESKDSALRNVGALLARWPLIPVLFGLGYALGRSLAGTICGDRTPFQFDYEFSAISIYYGVIGICIGLLLFGILTALNYTRFGRPWAEKLARFSILTYAPSAVLAGIAAGLIASATLGPLHMPECGPDTGR